MRPWMLRAIPMVAVPILLVAAVAVFGSAKPAPSVNESGARPAEAARVPGIEPLSPLALAQPAQVALAQEEVPADVPAVEAPNADDPAAEEAAPPADAENTQSPAEQPVSEGPAPLPPVATGEPAAAAPTGTPAPVAGAVTPTPTLDLAQVLEAPSVQTAIAQFSNMAPPLPPVPGQSGQPQGAPPAAQTQAAVMMATLTAPK